jgi:dTDP-4-amino-4,6-dideoxygalactose transaminase
MSISSSDVPLCDLSPQFRELQGQLEDAVKRVLASGQVINGPDVAAFEKECAAFCGAKHAVGCANGTDAISLALAALDIGPGDEVILPPFTFFATVGSVCRIGATPVFAEIDPVSYNIDPEEVRRKITPKTRAIMPVHLYGQCADMNAIREIAHDRGIPIVEDAAQAIGAELGGRRAGSLGTIGCFSFYPSKNLGAYGDAGLVTTDDDRLAAKLKALRVHGMEPKYFHKYLGWNARLDTIQAALLRVKLPHLERWTTQRQIAAGRYDLLLQQAGLDDKLKRPTRLSDRRHVFNQYVLRVSEGKRDALVKHLKENKIGCEIYYPVPLHLQECLSHLGFTEGDFPISEKAAREVIALPMFPEIHPDQQARVVQELSRFFGSAMRKAA